MHKTIITAITALSILGISASPGFSASDMDMNKAGTMMGQSGGMNHAAMGMKMNDETVLPKEGGQSAFATIAEIVKLLENDPDTDWSKVNIDALREHLVDMSELTLNTSVERAVENNKVVFKITGEGRTIKAIQTMVPAHSAVITKAGLFDATATKTNAGVIMRIAYKDENQLARIKALGFYGIMASGAQHQRHHFMMARGMM